MLVIISNLIFSIAYKISKKTEAFYPGPVAPPRTDDSSLATLGLMKMNASRCYNFRNFSNLNIDQQVKG